MWVWRSDKTQNLHYTYLGMLYCHVFLIRQGDVSEVSIKQTAKTEQMH